MRSWQPLGRCGDKGGKRAYVEEISQGFGRKEAKWQSNRLKKIQGAQRGLCKKHLPVKMPWVYIYLCWSVSHESGSTGSCKPKPHQTAGLSARPWEPAAGITCHCRGAPGSCLWRAGTLCALTENQSCIYYLRLLGEVFSWRPLSSDNSSLSPPTLLSSFSGRYFKK